MRLYVVNKYGGVYVDSDMELYEPIDKFLSQPFFMAMEQWGNKTKAGPHMFGSVPNVPLLTGLIQELEHDSFVKVLGFYNYYTLPLRISDYIGKRYHQSIYSIPNETKTIDNKYTFYPHWMFTDNVPGRKTYAKHHFSGTWYEEKYS